MLARRQIDRERERGREMRDVVKMLVCLLFHNTKKLHKFPPKDTLQLHTKNNNNSFFRFNRRRRNNQKPTTLYYCFFRLWSLYLSHNNNNNNIIIISSGKDISSL